MGFLQEETRDTCALEDDSMRLKISLHNWLGGQLFSSHFTKERIKIMILRRVRTKVNGNIIEGMFYYGENYDD